ncbi:MAG: hypothetical protein V3G42_01610 [Oscillospiraceae bacterium]
MKKKIYVLAVLAGMAASGVSMSVSANYENIDLTLNDEIRQKLANALDIEVALNSKQKEENSIFSVEKEEEIDVPDFTVETYNLDSAIEVYGFSTVELLDLEYFNKNFDTEPMYYVPFANRRSAGEVVVMCDDETGQFKVQSAYIPFNDNATPKFDMEIVKKVLLGVQDVNNVRICHDAMENFWIVDFTSENKEYMIPYYSEQNFSGWDTYIEQGEIYTPDEITEWLNHNIEPKIYEKGEVVFGNGSFFAVKEHPVIAPVSFWVGVASAVVAIGTGTILFRKKKNLNN